MITLDDFKALVKGGEKENVDFKLRCELFQADGLAPRAEFAKDICAMANNGPVASYLLIGVADSGKSFLTVSNNRLIDDNIQTFCKEAVYPPPRIELIRKSWRHDRLPFSGIEFVIIKIGPHPRQPFRLNRDFVSYKEKICYRRNEVWIRRGATSDLATPEEIGRLLKGQSHHVSQQRVNNRDYHRLHREHQAQVVRSDLANCLRELGGALHQDRIVLPIKSFNFVFRLVLLPELTSNPSALDYTERHWRYEHGVIFLVLGSVTKLAIPKYAELSFKEKWGWFTVQSTDFLSSSTINIGEEDSRIPLIPLNSNLMPLLIFTLPSIQDTETLYTSLSALVAFVESDATVFKNCSTARSMTNSNLRRLVRQGWVAHTYSYMSHGR